MEGYSSTVIARKIAPECDTNVEMFTSLRMLSENSLGKFV